MLNKDLKKQIKDAKTNLLKQKQSFISLESFKINSHVDMNQT
jgi:hypothetical protein